jgi:hypothetical protein
MKIYTKIDEFVLSNERNKWIKSDGIDLYVRNSVRFIDNIEYKCLDLASIEIKNKNKGVLTNLLKHLIDKNVYNLYIESILSPTALHVLNKFDFKEYYIGESLNMYLLINKKIKL